MIAFQVAEVFKREDTVAFPGLTIAFGQKLGEPSVCLAIFGKAEGLKTAGEYKPHTDNIVNAKFFSGNMAAYNACNAVSVGDRDSAITKLRCLCDQFVRMRCTAQEREVGRRSQLGIF